MKTWQPILWGCLLVGAGLAIRDAHPIAAGAIVQASPEPDDYNVALDVSQGSGYSTWTYTVTRPPTTAKEIPHFILFGRLGKTD